MFIVIAKNADGTPHILGRNPYWSEFLLVSDEMEGEVLVFENKDTAKWHSSPSGAGLGACINAWSMSEVVILPAAFYNRMSRVTNEPLEPEDASEI